ncbi:MAG TPA: hypothetical protein P5531_13470 [Bacteroidales bacterium]|nr:hypothetical protein [Bacteroidales bacterium]HSA44654.1 hypothetical protein [Bacteroidales bacterium]
MNYIVKSIVFPLRTVPFIFALIFFLIKLTLHNIYWQIIIGAIISYIFLSYFYCILEFKERKLFITYPIKIHWVTGKNKIVIPYINIQKIVFYSYTGSGSIPQITIISNEKKRFLFCSGFKKYVFISEDIRSKKEREFILFLAKEGLNIDLKLSNESLKNEIMNGESEPKSK